VAEAGEWHGWAHGDNAVFLSPHDDGEHIGLYLQMGRVTELTAVFVDPAMAQVFMDWMDDSLSATAAANSALVRRLEAEQPLAFVAPKPEITDEDIPDAED
jgi:hypothetical protein